MRAFRQVFTVWPVVLLSLVCSGCGVSALPPPVQITYRNSWVGLGKVIQITNTSAHHLYEVTVVVRSGMESASVRAADHLPPGATAEVGWLELEAWVPEPGELVEVYAEGYALPKVSRIPD